MSLRPGAPLRLSAALASLGLGTHLAASMRLALASGRQASAGALGGPGYFTVLTNLLVALVSRACIADGPHRSSEPACSPRPPSGAGPRRTPGTLSRARA